MIYKLNLQLCYVNVKFEHAISRYHFPIKNIIFIKVYKYTPMDRVNHVICNRNLEHIFYIFFLLA